MQANGALGGSQAAIATRNLQVLASSLIVPGRGYPKNHAKHLQRAGIAEERPAD